MPSPITESMSTVGVPSPAAAWPGPAATLPASSPSSLEGDDTKDGGEDVRALVAEGVFHSASPVIAQPWHMLRREGTVQSSHISRLQREQ